MEYYIPENRRKKKPPQPSSWFLWRVSTDFRFNYILMMFLLLFVIPWILGTHFSPLGLLLNTLLVDFIIYAYINKS